jgi:hypothetical protein
LDDITKCHSFAQFQLLRGLPVQSLESGSFITKAAQKAGVARETFSRRVQSVPVFVAELQRREMLRESIKRLLGTLSMMRFSRLIRSDRPNT